jgi:hypothetical protein
VSELVAEIDNNRQQSNFRAGILSGTIGSHCRNDRRPTALPDDRPAFLSPWRDAAKAEPRQIKLIDKDIDRPDRIILAQVVIQPLGKQSALNPVIANDKARHRILRPNRRRIIS